MLKTKKKTFSVFLRPLKIFLQNEEEEGKKALQNDSY